MSNIDHNINTLPPDPASRATEVVATQLPAIIRAAYAELVSERDRLRAELAEARDDCLKLSCDREELTLQLDRLLAEMDGLRRRHNVAIKDERLEYEKCVLLRAELDRAREQIASEYIRGREHEQAARANVENAHIASLREQIAEATKIPDDTIVSIIDHTGNPPEIDRLQAVLTTVKQNLTVGPCNHRTLADTLTEEDVERMAKALADNRPFPCFNPWHDTNNKDGFRKCIRAVLSEFRATPTRGPMDAGELAYLRAHIADVRTQICGFEKIVKIVEKLTGEKGGQP